MRYLSWSQSVAWYMDDNKINESSTFHISENKLFIVSLGVELDGKEISCRAGNLMASVLLLASEGAGLANDVRGNT